MEAPEGIVQKDRWIFAEHSLIWVLPPALRGLRHGLKQEDFPGLPHALSSGGLRQRAVLYRSQGLPLWRVLWNLLWRDFIGAIFFGFGQGFFAVVARPLLLRAIIGVTEDTERDPMMVTLLLVLLVSSLALEGFCIAGSKHTLGERFGTGAFTVVVTLLHDKCWRIRDSATKTDVVNVLGNDCNRCLEYGKALALFPASLTMVVGGIVVVFTTMDPVSGTVGLASICAVLLLNARIARITQRTEAQNLAKADERMAIVQQLINGIRAVKLSAWEESYLEKIKQARIDECVPMQRYRVWNQSQIQIGRANPILAACVTFCIFGLRGGNLDPGNIFAALNVFLGMRMALIILPESFSYMAGVRVVLRRIEEYLNLPEVETTVGAGPGAGPGGTAPTSQGALALQDVPCKEPVARITGFTASWSDEGDFRLQVPHFTAWPGQLVAVVGPVASGKSSLLLALLGEMGSGSSTAVQLRGAVGYVGQRPFVLADTVRANIVMGRDYDEELLGEALWRAALDEDVDALPVHVDTFIGERGVSLSGGQQQRLALARALYGTPPLLLCDDPLSALDAPTAKAVFERGLQPHPDPAGRAAVVVLNQDHLLPEFDVAFELKDGNVRPRDPKAVPSPRSVDHAWSASEKSPKIAGCSNGAGDDRVLTVTSTKTFRSYGTVPVEKKKSTSSTVAKEASASGVVGWAIIRRYIVGFQGKGKDGPCRYLFFAVAVGTAMITYVLMAAGDRWLAVWVSVVSEEPDTPPVPYVGVYFGLCVGFVFMLLLSSCLFSIGSVRSGREMHNDCIQRLLHAPLSFFEATPSGRITSRFSADLGVVDMVLGRWADNTLQILMTLLIIIAQILSLLPVLCVPLALALAAYAGVVITVNIMSREAKRLQNAGMSPVQTAMREASDGKVVLRAMNLGRHMNERLVPRSDALGRFIYFGNTVIAWGMLMSCVTGALLTSVAAFVAMVWDIAGDPSDAALVLTYCFIVPYFLQFMSLCVMSVLQALPSLERLLQYSEGTYVPQEAAWDMPGDEAWKAESKASRGMEIVFEDVSLTYAAGLAPAVCGASFQIRAGERLGVVGRTGAGKSSLLLLLLRVREPTNGRILLGGADAQTLGLMTLRRAVGVIPQTPLLISGSVRKNLDPWQDYSDQQLQSVVQKVGLGSLTPPSEHNGNGKQMDANASSVLEAPATELSAGERQLLSVARCLLRTTTVRAVLLDEPTSNIDLDSDAVVNSVIREELACATLITIAHRLHTVVDSDRVLVMDQGTSVELAPPAELLSNSESHFAGMARSLGPAVLEELLHLAKSAAEAKAGGLDLEHVRLETVSEHPTEEARAAEQVDARPHLTTAGKPAPFSIGCQNPLRCLFPSP